MANMKLLQSKFTKVKAEKEPSFSGKLSMKTSIKILNIDKLKEAKDVLKLPYAFEIDYADLGNIKIEGSIFISADNKTSKEILNQWKDKKLDSPEMASLTNLIIQKASIKAFQLEEELGLPIHIKLPSLSSK